MRRTFWVIVSIVVAMSLAACGDDAPVDQSTSLDGGNEHDATEVVDAADAAEARDTTDSTTPPEALYIYADSLSAPWIDASWDANVDFGATQSVHAGTRAIEVVQQVDGALSFLHGDWGDTQLLDPADFTSVSFAIYSEQALDIDVVLQGEASFERLDVGSLPAGQWTTVTVPMSDLAPGGELFHRVNIRDVSGSQVTYYVDEVRLIGGSSGHPDAGHPSDGGDAGDADAHVPDTGPLPHSEFVTVDPNAPRFLLDGQPFYFVGTNLYWMVQRRAYGHAMVDDAFDMCQAMGLRVIRMWGFADGHDWTNPSDAAIMQSEAGVFNESTFEALDYVLAEAEKHDVKVVIALINYWEDYGGMLQYARWAGGSSHEYFYTELATRQMYKDYVTKMLTRVNTITGEEYRNDPTIMAWELANEARAPFDDGAQNATLELWYTEMAAYVRSLDANHLIATGEEGWDTTTYASQYSDSYTNDYALRGSQGTSYVDNTSLADISYGGAHLYPDVWGFSSALEDGRHWITDHAKLARQSGKPFVLGEFGYRDRSVYQGWLETAEQEDVAGTLMWQIVPASRGRENEMTVVYPNDTDLVDIFSQHAQYMNSKGATSP